MIITTGFPSASPTARRCAENVFPLFVGPAMPMMSGVFSRTAGRKVMLIVSGIGAALAAAVGLYDMNNYAAIGLYLTLFGGLALESRPLCESSSRKTLNLP